MWAMGIPVRSRSVHLGGAEMTATLRTLRLEYSLPDDKMCEVWESGFGIERQIFVVMRRETKPAVRMTQKSMYVDPSAMDYLDWKHGTADLVQIALNQTGIRPFPKGTRLKMDARFELAPVKTWIEATEKRKGHWRTTHPGLEDDLNNLMKGIEDALKGVLYVDDKWFFEHHCWKSESDKDWTELWVRQC